MAFRSKFTGPQVSKAVKIMIHKNAGTVLTYDTSANFPKHATNFSRPEEDSLEGDYFRDSSTGLLYDENNMLIASKYLFVDASSNIMYRWRFVSEEEWLESNDDLTEYPSDGYAYVPCSGSGGDIFWEPLD